MDVIIIETRPGQGHSEQKNNTKHSAIKRCSHTPNLGFLPQIVQEICSGNDYSRNQVRGQGHSDLKLECDTLPSQDDTQTTFGIPTSNNVNMLQTHLF